jgi:hypothetical protein
LDVSPQEIEARLRDVMVVDRPVTGMLSKYRQLVTTAARGAVVE